MNNAHSPITYKGRSLGIVLLTAVQSLVEFIHVLFGFWLLIAPRITPFVSIIGSSSSAADIYSFYTIIFGFLTLLYARFCIDCRSVGVGQAPSQSWSLLLLLFFFTLLDLPSVPGIPKFACYDEITYSVLVIFYLVQSHIRAICKINLDISELNPQNAIF